MSTRTIQVAIADDEPRDSDAAPHSSPALDNEAAAMSQPRQAKEADKRTPRKKRARCHISSEEDNDTPVDRRKKTFQKNLPKKIEVAALTDGMLEFFNEAGECLGTVSCKTPFFRVSAWEQWLIQYCALARKKMSRGFAALQKRSINSGRHTKGNLCKALLVDFRKTVEKAKHAHKKKTWSRFPAEFEVDFNGKRIHVHSSTLHIMVRADEKAVAWIRHEFDRVVQQHLTVEMSNAVTAGEYARCGEDKIDSYTGLAIGVRDKIVWKPELLRWVLKSKGNEDINILQHCREHNLNICVDESLNRDEFKQERNRCLYNACIAWNQLDKSKAHRIKLPAVGETCTSISVVPPDSDLDTSDSDTDSDSDIESAVFADSDSNHSQTEGNA